MSLRFYALSHPPPKQLRFSKIVLRLRRHVVVLGLGLGLDGDPSEFSLDGPQSMSVPCMLRICSLGISSNLVPCMCAHLSGYGFSVLCSCLLLHVCFLSVLCCASVVRTPGICALDCAPVLYICILLARIFCLVAANFFSLCSAGLSSSQFVLIRFLVCCAFTVASWKAIVR